MTCKNGGSCASEPEGSQYDDIFACVCTAGYIGATCEGETAGEPEQDNTSAIIAGGLVAVFFVVGVLGVLGYRYRLRQVKMRAYDFAAKLAEMCDAGELDAADSSLIPREIKRSHVTLITQVGAGAFGEVWKGVLDESSAGGVPG